MNMSILDSLLCVIIKDRGVIQGFLRTGNQAFFGRWMVSPGIWGYSQKPCRNGVKIEN